jgi:glycosidase
MSKVPGWLAEAVIYQVYPQSFQDSNGDGIGDLPGLIERLDYIRDLGATVIWLNPVFASPFRDAGYDVSDFYHVAPRYGTDADMRRLCREAHRRGLRVMLDLVTAHTAIDHPWFAQSQRHRRNRFSDWYIWTDDWWLEPQHPDLRFVWGQGERPGSYVNNFFWSQPALNYGFGKPDRPWQQPVTAPGPRAVRAEMIRIMRHWLRQGCDGFRVDSAKSLVKQDPGFTATAAFWADIIGSLRRDFPEVGLLAEWGDPGQALQVGFHSDFVLHNTRAYQAMLMAGERATSPHGTFFDPAGAGDPRPFIEEFAPWWRATRGRGCIAMPTSNHDTRRISTGRDTDTLEQCFAFLMTLPAIPVVYYGEEIGLRHLDGLPSKEGGYIRTGARTPMQWDASRNAGFSTAAAADLYLPIDPSRRRPTVAAQAGDADSLLNRVRRITGFRRTHLATLQPAAEFTVLAGTGYPLVYLRSGAGRRLLCAFNPSAEPVQVRLPRKAGIAGLGDGLGRGSWSLRSGVLRLAARSWCVVAADAR